MTTVFLSGSRAISRLNDLIRNRISNIIANKFQVIIGDANGADKALQKYLMEVGYNNVTVYCAGGSCRNNLGQWSVKEVSVEPGIRGREFYTQKDKVMAADADFGFVLWDGKSAGSINNVFELLKRGKSVVIYLSKTQSFVNVAAPEHLNTLLDLCNDVDFQKIDKKINVSRRMQELDATRQGSLNF